MKKIAITGATGLVGSRIVELLADSFEFLPISHKEVDITNREQVQKYLSAMDFDIFLHIAAYTNVDGAETDRETAKSINVDGTRNVFMSTQQKGAKFIYISTDFVFDGKNPPYNEDSTPSPSGYYGQTKYEGEEVVKNQAMIVRISYPYRASFEPKMDFVRKLKSLMEQGKELTMMTDSAITPTFIDDIAYSLKYLMANFSPEIYHIVGSQTLSPFEAGRLIARTFGLNEGLVKPTTYAEFSKGKALRPQWSEINSKKNTFYKMKSFEEGLKKLLK